MKLSKLLIFCLALLLLISACKPALPAPEVKKANTVEVGKTITFDYAAGFDNSTLYDTSFEDVAKKAGIYNPDRVYQPVKVVYTKDSLFPGLSEALLGMKEGETKNVRMPPDKAYGVLIPNATVVFPKNKINNSENLKISDIVAVIASDGRKVNTYVKQIGAENITLDLNHPLAGQYVQFSIVVRSIE